MAKKRKHLLMARNTRALEQGLPTSKGVLKFGNKNSAMYINDAGFAREVDEMYGLKGSGDIWVHEDPMAEHWEAKDRSDIHHYTFPGIETPWRKKRWRPQEDPEWEEYAPGRWREIPEKRDHPERELEDEDDGEEEVDPEGDQEEGGASQDAWGG